jgi:1-deoxy-D-xylulose-5-phosphate reductoisomerase
MKKKIAILGSTGSIGKSLLDVISKDKNNFDVVLLTANKNSGLLLLQAKKFKVKNVILADESEFNKNKMLFVRNKIQIYNNFKSLNEIFKKKIDYTMSAVIGLDGLYPTIEIIKFSKTIGIANKESIICAWDLISKQLKKYKTNFIPIDSEHFSIWSLVENSKLQSIKNIYITASGGPFLKYKLNNFKNIKISDALKHPNWKMGKKITIDSSTMMNKVFEVIETNRIFTVDLNKISILTHEKSYLHAIIEFNDGLIKFLAHETDMKIPIFNSLYYDVKKNYNGKKINLSYMNNLNLKKIETQKFPVIKILKKYPKRNTLFDTVIVSANDTLVKLFLEKKISFIDISKNLINFSKNKKFSKYKKITPKSVDEIYKLSKYVSLKILSKCI